MDDNSVRRIINVQKSGMLPMSLEADPEAVGPSAAFDGDDVLLRFADIAQYRCGEGAADRRGLDGGLPVHGEIGHALFGEPYPAAV